MKRTALTLFTLVLLLVLIGQTDKGSRAFSRVWHWMDRTAAVAVDSSLSTQSLQADYAMLIDAATGNVLYAHQETKRAYPASTTKIMTALLALELGKADEIVEVGPEVHLEDPQESRAGLKVGQQWKLYDLVEAALLPSGNDAARAVAVYIGRKASDNPKLSPTEAQQYFVTLMNKRAKKIGATQTHYTNPHGLHDADHYTTAQDLARIAREAMRNKQFQAAVRAADHTATATVGGMKQNVQLTNTNQLLQREHTNYFEGATGIKTGFTDEAGYCLVSSASRGGRTVIAVVLHSTNKAVYTDARQLLQLGFASQK